MKKFWRIFWSAAAAVLVAGYLIPERKAMPCGTPGDYNHQSFWYWPWTRGTEGCPHTGIDIFGKTECREQRVRARSEVEDSPIPSSQFR